MSRAPLSDIPIFHETHERSVHRGEFRLGEQKRYYSSIDIDMYFGDYYVDEIVDMQFQVQQNMMPIYGYNSYVFDDMAIGNRIIQGMFVINFTSPGYLFKITNDLKGMLRTRARVTEDSPLWNKGFDIDIVYGRRDIDGRKRAELDSDLVIKDAYINSCTQQFSINGEPVMEQYQFMAKDILPL